MQAWGERDACSILVRNPIKMDHLKDLVVDGKFILKWILEEYDTIRISPGKVPALIRLRIGRSAELL